MDFLAHLVKDYGGRWNDLARLSYPFEDYMKAIPVASYKPFEMVRPRLKIGIEVEVEKVAHHLGVNMANEMWMTREDGSLRQGGIEFVSIPIADQQIPWAIHYLFDQYLPKDADFSARTSIHVHVNVRNWSCKEILNLILLYIVFERLLYRFAGPQRYQNIFCVPIRETKLPIVLSNYLANGNFQGLLESWTKYSGLNLVPIRKFGTVEYRHMRGHRNTEYLLNWINVIQQLHKTACNVDFIELFDEIKMLNTTSSYEQFLMNTFKDQSVFLLGKCSLQREMEYGVSIVKSIQPPSQFIKKLLNDISNESDLLQSLKIIDKQTKKDINYYAPGVWDVIDGVVR